MKKVILTISALVIAAASFAQTSTSTSQRLKYVTTAPDGSVAMTITDDTSKKDIKLESANTFYKYELLDPKTGEPVFASANKGKECSIDKTKLSKGTYNLRLYTSSFVITSQVTIRGTETSTGVVG